jgi:hypothetical protein
MMRSSLVPGVVCLVTVLVTAGCSSGGHQSGPPVASSPFVVHTDPAVEQLASGVRVDLDGLVNRELAMIAGALHSPNATVNFVVNARAAIPEVGVGGFTNPQTGVVTVSLDPQSRVGVERTLGVWVPITLAHELNHSTRILDGPGYGNTLVETIVTEGIADEFSRSLHADGPAIPWDDVLTPRQQHDLWTAAQGQTTNLTLHAEWFFGTGHVPRWAGYTLGAHVLAAYRARNAAVPWAEVTRLPAAQIVAASGYLP